MSKTVPFFQLNETTGKYKARRNLTDNQIIKAAKTILANKLDRVDLFTDVCTTKNYLITRFSDKEYEIFTCLFLDNKHRLIACEELFRGTIDGANVYPREVVKQALVHNASAVIFCHNHPSGITDPSGADMSITRKLKEALSTVDIRTLDHVIVGADSAYSFAEHKKI